MTLTVALTGATGFIGGRIAAHLTASGHQVRALVRRPERAGALKWLGADLVSGSLADGDALAALVDGVDAVVHCAGAVRGVALEDFAKVNVSGVQRMVDALLAMDRPARLLCLSSLAAREPGLSNYAASKRHGEQVLEAQSDALEWVALRPPAVYGPGDKELLPLFRWMQRGLAPIVGDRGGRFSMLYVDDLAAAVEAWLANGHGVTGAFEIDDGRAGGYSWDEIVAEAAALRGAAVRPLPVPRAVLALIARTTVTAARLFGFAPMLSPGKVRELRHPDWVCDSGRWRAAVSWEPQVEFGEGLRRTLSG